MTCNTTQRNGLLNGHRKRGSAAISFEEDESEAGCCGEASVEQRYKETRMNVLRHTAPAVAEEEAETGEVEAEDMPQQRYVDDWRKDSTGTRSGLEAGVGGLIEGTSGRVNCGRVRNEHADWGEGVRMRGQRLDEQSTGGSSMGGQSKGGQSIGGQNTRGQSMRGQSMGGQSIGGQRLETRSMGLPLDGGERQGKRKLILHFDIRNTILVADSVTRVKVEQALNTFLTGVTWGREGGNGWEWLSKTPSLGPPCDGAITYYKYLERQLARAPDDRALLRQATGDFTQVPLGWDFRPYFEKHLRLLRWNHDAPDEMLTMVGCDKCRYHYLVPSFVRLLYHLEADGRDFAVVLRTYGMDARNVLSCLQHIVNGHHPDFPGHRLPINVRRDPGRVTRHEDGSVEFRVVEAAAAAGGSGEPEAATERVYSEELRIYEMLSGSRGISGFVDDFGHWQRNGYSHRSGKPFWIDLEDDAVQHVFFDDNIRVTADDSIVDVRLATPNGRGRGFESIGLDRMSDFEDACLVQADLLDSIDNVEYFVDKVRTCERNYARLTAGKGRSRSPDWNAA